MAGVESRIARRRITRRQIALEDLLGTPEAFGHVVARQLDVHPTGPGPLGAVHVEERPQLRQDVVEAARLVATLAGERVPVHGVADPHDGVALGLDGPHDGWQQRVDLVCSQPGDEREATGEALWVQALADRHDLGRGAAGPDLGADRIVDARQELEMGTVELAGTVAHPDHVGRTVVPVVGQGVDPGQALLVGQDQRLVTRPEVDLVQTLFGSEVDATGRHEAQGAVDLGGDALVASPFRRRRDELLVPQVHLGQIGEASLGEGAQQVERRGRLLVGGQQSLGIGPARFDFERLVVDHVTPERRQLQVADPFGGGRTRLGELPGNAAHLDDGDAGGVGESDRHLENDLQLVPDGVGGEFGKRLGAVTGLQQEHVAVGDVRQLRREVACLAGEDEWWHGGQSRLGLLERVRVGPLRLLGGRELPPGRGAPRGGLGWARHRNRLTP